MVHLAWSGRAAGRRLHGSSRSGSPPCSPTNGPAEGTGREHRAAGDDAEEGGTLCHAAIVARELGVAGVIGAQGAMAIPHGATVEVDPVVDVVRIVGGAASTRGR